MFDLLRRASPRNLAAGALAAAVAVAGVVAALLGEYGPALTAVIFLLAATVLHLARANARLQRRLDRQHQLSMRYAVKADKRLRTLDARISLLNRTLDARARETSADVEAATRRVLAAVETERFAAAERHQAIAASLEQR